MTGDANAGTGKREAGPLYRQIKEAIKARIASGELQFGDRAPSEREICEGYGVSKITAVRATTDLVKEGVLRRERGRATYVAYRSRPDSKTHALGVGVYEVDYIFMPSFSPIVGGLAEVASADGYQIQLVVVNGQSERNDGSLYNRVLSKGRVDGFGLIDHSISDSEIVDLHAHGIPLVLFDRVVPGQDFCSVLVDNRGGTFQAVEHLHELGHVDIGYVTYSLSHPPARERYEGFRSILEIRGLQFHPEWVVQYHGHSNLREADIARLVEGPNRPTALVCFEDYSAIRTMGYLQRLGYRVPDDFSVTGFDDIDQADLNMPSLTTIHSGLRELGGEMGRMLLAQMDGEPVAERVYRIPAELVVRESTGPAPDAG